MWTLRGIALVLAVFAAACTESPTWPRPVTQTQTETATQTPAPTPTPTSQAVTHTLTMTVSPSCAALPDAARKRTYPTQFRENSNGDLLVLVVDSGVIMVGWGANLPGFTGKRVGNMVSFTVTDDIFNSYAMVERIPGVGDMGYFGTAVGTIDSGKIVATFNGEYRLGYGSGPVLCQASDHLMEITPAGSQ